MAHSLYSIMLSVKFDFEFTMKFRIHRSCYPTQQFNLRMIFQFTSLNCSKFRCSSGFIMIHSQIHFSDSNFTEDWHFSPQLTCGSQARPSIESLWPTAGATVGSSGSSCGQSVMALPTHLSLYHCEDTMVKHHGKRHGWYIVPICNIYIYICLLYVCIYIYKI